jgi:hypothetical protein
MGTQQIVAFFLLKTYFFSKKLTLEERGFVKTAQFSALQALNRHFAKDFHRPNSDHQVT